MSSSGHHSQQQQQQDEISISDITTARNSKLAAEQADTQRISAELQGAHEDALHLKDQLRQRQGESAVPQQQAFPHGGMSSPSVGEKVAEGVASTDQTITTAVRDAVHRVSEGVSAAGNAAAEAAGTVADKAREAVKATTATKAANDGGGQQAGGYQGVVFSSDDPEYKQQGANPTIASPSEPTKPGPLASLTNSLLTPNTSSSRHQQQQQQHMTIATPTEPQPATFGEGRVGVAAGDPAGGANVVAAARTAGKGIVASVKDAFTGSGSAAGTAGAPAGPSDPDPRTANIPVGDFKALHEALHLSKDTSGSRGSSSGASDRDNAAATTSGSSIPSAQDMREGWEGLKSQAQEGLEAASDRVQQGLEAASERVQEATTTSTATPAAAAAGPDSSSVRGTGAAGGGLLSGLAGVVSGIATKVNLASNSEELLAGGTVPDEAAGPAAAAGPTTATAPEATAAANAAADAAGRARDAVTPDSSSSDSGSDTVAAAKEAASDTAERVKQGAADVRDKVSEQAHAASEGVSNAGQRVKNAASDAATRVSDAAASAKQTAADAAASAKDTVTGTAASAKQAAADAAASAKDTVTGTAASAKQTVADAAASAKDTVTGTAASAKDTVTGTAASAKQTVADAAASAKDTVTGTAASAQDSTAAAAQSAADKASESAADAKSSAAGGLSSLVQGAKEGFVGAYDAAAAVLVGGGDDDNKPSATATPAVPAPSAQHGDTPAAANPPANVAGAGGSHGDELQSGAVGSGHASVPHIGLGAVLKQGWEDLKHGGAKAPHATSTGGETAAAHDVTSNIERSRHLDDAQQAKIYKAETYSVAPGAQAASDQAATDAHTTGAVAGDKRPVTGTVPHDKPDTYRVHADEATRFEGDKGMSPGFGTGSAAPWSGDDSVKTTAALFAAQPAGRDGPDSMTQADRAGSSATGESGVRGWVSSMSAAWRHLGVASAKGPTGKEVKAIHWDNPTQDAVVDPVRGVTKTEGHSPGHKIQMRTNDQIPPDSDVTDPQLYKDKAERLGKVVSDTLTTSSSEAAADPTNLKGKSSDNKPDGLQHFLKHEAGTAADAASRVPGAAVSALGTAGEIVAGVAGHVVDKAKELGHNITQHGDFMSAHDRAAKTQAAVARAEKQVEQLGDLATDHRAVQELQEERMAAIGDPAHRRETLEDKVIGPLVKDASDDTNAKALAASYKEWRGDMEHGTSPQPAESGSAGSSSSIGGAVRGLGQEAADTATEAVDTAKATGEVVSMEVSSAADAVKGKADEAASRVTDTARDAKHSAQDTARDAKHSAQDTAERAKHSAQDTAERAKHSAQGTAERARDTTADAAHRAGDSACGAADSVKDAVARAGHSVRETADAAGAKLQEGVDAVAEGSGRVVGAGAERVSEAQDAAARAGHKAGAAAGGVLSSVGETAKGLLGALLGPFEREGAFDESTAALTGPPDALEPVGAEQLPAGHTDAQAPAVKSNTSPPRTPATSFTITPAGAAPSSSSQRAAAAAQAPAGAAEDAVDAAADVAGKVKGRAAELKEGIKDRLQADIDDTAHAAGLTAGHIASAVEGAKQQIAAVQDKVAAVTEDIHVPPAELTTNTEDLLRARQQAAQQH